MSDAAADVQEWWWPLASQKEDPKGMNVVAVVAQGLISPVNLVAFDEPAQSR